MYTYVLIQKRHLSHALKVYKLAVFYVLSLWIKRGWGDHYRYRARVRVMTLRSFRLIKSELRELILEYLIHLSLLTKTTYCPTDNPSSQNPPPSPIPSTPRPRKKNPTWISLRQILPFFGEIIFYFKCYKKPYLTLNVLKHLKNLKLRTSDNNRTMRKPGASNTFHK